MSIDDSKAKPVVKCRLWLKLQLLDTALEDTQMKPSKVSNHLRLIEGAAWCQADVALGEDRLVGPFDFMTARAMPGPACNRATFEATTVRISM